MFNPTEIIFAVTTACNLHCEHCFIDRAPHKLKIQDAINLLKSCKDSTGTCNIEKIGFSGGEPFLYLDFLCEVTKAAVQMDFMFDQIITNGDWWIDESDLMQKLQTLYDAGYDGKIGLSWDSYHGQSTERMETFIACVQELFGDDSINIQTVDTDAENTEGGSLPLAPAVNIASSFSEKNSGKPLHKFANHVSAFTASTTPSNGALQTTLQPRNAPKIYHLPRTYTSQDERAWQARRWFREDFCEGPGQILYVHADGNIAPCCGFANENPELFIGKITDNFEEIMQNAATNKMVKICYEEGLAHYRRHGLKKKLRADGKKLPGKTADICSFCDFVCKLH
jgi:organic radical activating enzyme